MTELLTNLYAYIAICNEILDANKNRFPFTQMWQALEAEIAGRPIEFSVTRNNECATAMAIFAQCQLNLIDLSGSKKWPAAKQQIEWAYMARVLENPAKFIANPSLVDWNLKIDDKIVPLFS